MCRWFAYVSPSEPCLLEDVLITPAHALSKQVHAHYLPKLISHVPGEETTESEISSRNRLFNIDGFGLAWYSHKREEFVNDTTGPRPALYKHVSLFVNFGPVPWTAWSEDTKRTQGEAMAASPPAPNSLVSK